jgi:hypothetical protein
MNERRDSRSPATRMCKGHSYLECDAVWSGRKIQTFGQKVLAPSGSLLLHPEDGRSMFLRQSVYSARRHLENLQPGRSVSLCMHAAACITRSMPSLSVAPLSTAPVNLLQSHSACFHTKYSADRAVAAFFVYDIPRKIFRKNYLGESG